MLVLTFVAAMLAAAPGATECRCRSDCDARSSLGGNGRDRPGCVAGRGAAHPHGGQSYIAEIERKPRLRAERMPLVELLDFVAGPSVMTVDRYFSFLTPTSG